ncbi:MAG: KpsF/GutQ family sugar-phosphate isomerase [bacterium]
MNIKTELIKVLDIEAAAILKVRSKIDSNFEKAISYILACKGKVVIFGIGKSGLIGQKIAATMSSTGTPAIFLHSTEAAHGDLGMVSKNDVAMVISQSGETDEVIGVLPAVKRFNIPLISITGKKSSTLAKNSDCVLDSSVKEEACPMGLAPTASTTVQLAIGDALAVVLLKLKKFKKEDFAMFHPGGTLGKKLMLSVADIMHKDNAVPIISGEMTLQKGLLEITAKRMGCTAVVNNKGIMTGIFTDGDLRRLLEKNTNPYSLKMNNIMTINPKIISATDLAVKALGVMEKNAITVLVVVDKKNKPEGVIHLHDILKSGVV